MRICIIEDDEPLLDNLRLLLGGEPSMTVIGAFKSAEDALRGAVWKKIDVLLVDIELPEMSGIELIRRLSPFYPHMRIIVYTIHDDRPVVLDAIKAGACGYLLKGVRPSELIAAINEIYDGGAPMSPSIARAVLNELKTQTTVEEHPAPLTERELTVLRHLQSGLMYKEIASRLSVSTTTVHTHIKHIYDKLHVKSRSDAIRKGKYQNLI